MGTYLNPGKDAFQKIVNGEYVDKTGMIALLNRTIGTTKNLACISRPRRFGKSFAAKMLCAYYDCTCDSHLLFDGREIARTEGYTEHLNRYNVICLDITSFISDVKKRRGSLVEIPLVIEEAIRKDMVEAGFFVEDGESLNEALLRCVGMPDGKPFVFIIDEWDALIREAKGDAAAQDAYLNLLRGWFKNTNFTPKAVAAAFMTGILPIKKDGSQSAISDFQEYSMLDPRGYAKYFGFAEAEVRGLCQKHAANFADMKRWYDGYTIGDCDSIYNPYSVMQSLDSGKYRSYWKKTSAAEALMTYIDMDEEGLQGELARLLAGERVVVDTDSFQNDVETFDCKDDVLTLLIHLGYLTYEEENDSYDEDAGTVTGLARVPNEEVRTEFGKILRKAKHRELLELVRKSDQLLRDTLAGNADAVAAAVEEVRSTSYAPNYYNNEQSLRYVIKMAYISCVDQYARVEELPSGHGIEDVVFLPKRRSSLPAMVVEMKWNKSAGGALRQIKDRDYPKILKNYGGEVILVGINYDSETKQHTCVIEKCGK